jgi:hypothetical protein
VWQCGWVIVWQCGWVAVWLCYWGFNRCRHASIGFFFFFFERDPANPTDLYSEEWVAVVGWQWQWWLGGCGGSGWVVVWLGGSVAG